LSGDFAVSVCTAGSRTGSPSSRSQPAIVPTASRLNSRVQQTANRNASPTRLYGICCQQLSNLQSHVNSKFLDTLYSVILQQN